ncbi:hypothetical protein ABFG93_21090 [Pseudalkalibacillus hwajinpoensis]|uniref:hypothetical protein n=1 Tax=Guptibacillus hwajinpoensis TaxID=208199 RepID=UPI00325B0AB3
MRSKVSFIIVLLAIVLFCMNPEQEDYSTWIGEQLNKDQNTLIEIGVDIAVLPYIKVNTSRTEGYLFSIYRTILWNGKEVVSIGIFNHFYIKNENLNRFVDE